MSLSEADLRLCIHALESNSITEKKKGMDRMREMVNDKKVIKFLNRTSKRGTHDLDWNLLFDNVHRFLLRETDKIRAEESKGTMSQSIRNRRETMKNDCSSLVFIIVSKANQDVPHITCSSLVGSALDILDRNYYRNSYADKYVEIVRSRIMPFRKYWGDMKPELWKNLLDTFVNLLKNPPHQMEKSSIVEVLNALVIRGAYQSHLSLIVKNKFLLVADAFCDTGFYNSRTTYQEWLLQLSITLCTQLAKECRLAACHFGEKVAAPVMSLYEKFTMKNKNLLFHFLLLQVHLHHPQGASQNDGAAYARDWEQWNCRLKSLYIIIESEIRKVQEMKYSFNKETSLHPVFLQLAVEVCKQVFENSTAVLDVTVTSADEEMHAVSSKRRRVVFGLQSVMDSLKAASNPHHMWPWLSLINAFMTKYPRALKECDFLSLLHLIAELLNACKDSLIMDYLCQCCISLVKVEKHLYHNLDDQTVKSLWHKIWETTLRTVGLNQSEKNSHLLLQTLITHDKAVHPMELVQIFISGAIKLSVSSVQTLDMLLSSCSVPDAVVSWTWNTSNGMKTIKTALLDWLLPDRTGDSCCRELDISYMAPILAKVLIDLTLRTSIVNVTDAPSEIGTNGSELDCLLKSVDEGFVLSSFERGLAVSRTVDEPSLKKNVPDCQIALVNSVNRDTLMNLLTRDSNSLIMQMQHGGVLKVLPCVFNHISLLLEIWSRMLRLKIINPDVAKSFSEKLKSLMEHLSTYITGTLSKMKWEHNSSLVEEILKGLGHLLRSNYYQDAVLALQEWISSEMLEELLRLFKAVPVIQTDDMNDDMLDMDCTDSRKCHEYDTTISQGYGDVTLINGFVSTSYIEHITSIQKIQLEAANVLLYCCDTGVYQLREAPVFLKRLLQELSAKSTDAESFTDFCLTFVLKNPNPNSISEETLFLIIQAAEVLKYVLHVSSLSTIHVSEILHIIQTMCRTWYQDSEGVCLILQLIKDSLIHVRNLGGSQEKENVMRLIQGMKKNLVKKQFGPSVCCRFIECLSELAKLDPNASWSMWNCGTMASVNPSPAAEEILAFLNSPFHEVRMFAVKNISVLFAHKLNDLQWQTVAFDQIFQLVMNSFIVEGDLTEEEKMDEYMNRAACALHTFAALIVISPVLRKKALFAILQLIKEKNVNVDLVYKVLNLIGVSLNMQSTEMLMATNLKYLLTQWFEESFSLQEFPWVLLNCQSELAFYGSYKEIIVPMLLHRQDEQALSNVCDKMSCPEEKLMEECYPQIMACVLPYFSSCISDSSYGISEQELVNAERIYEKLERTLTKQQPEMLLKQHLDKVVTVVMQHVYDSDHFIQLCGFEGVLPQPDCSSIKMCIAKKVFSYLQIKFFSRDMPLFVFLCKRLPSSIQSTLLQLNIVIHNAPTLEDKLIPLHQYCALAYVLGCELENLSLGNMSHYIIREIFHTLINIMKQSYKNGDIEVTAAACHFLKQFTAKCLPSCSHIVSKFLIVIVSTLVPFSRLDNKVGIEAHNLLQFLIIENYNSLSSAISSLDPFPGDSIFKDMQAVYKKIKYNNQQYTLEDEIKHFLNSDKVNLGCRTEGLQDLQLQLSQRKDELKYLYDNLTSVQGFSEDCANSVLHQLICTLVELACIPEYRVSIEASRCLGELGPSDLTTMVLKPESKQSALECNDPKDLLQAFAGHVIRLLAAFLVDEDINVVKAASDALYIVLESKEGQNALENALFKPNETLSQEYLTPFLPQKKNRSISCVNIDEEYFKLHLDQSELWCPNKECDHAEWITRLVCVILKTFSGNGCFLPSLVPVCRAKVSFSESIIPFALVLLLNVGTDDCQTAVWHHMQHFFQQHFSRDTHLQMQPSSASIMALEHSGEISLNKASVQCMLNIVDFMRLVGRSQKLVKRNDTNLNYLHVAQAAQFCSAYFTSVLYMELWCDSQLRNVNIEEDIMSRNTTMLECVFERNLQDASAAQNILREAYMKIGDSDAVYGCGSSHLLDPCTRLHHYEVVGKWDKVMLTYDAEMTNRNMKTTRGLLTALQNCSLHHVLNGYMKSLDNEIKSKQEDVQFECAWRLAQWDMTNVTNMTDYRHNSKSNFHGSEFEMYHFFGLKAMHEADVTSLEQAVAGARKCVIESLAHASLESSRNLYKALSQLQQIQELEDFASVWKSNNQDLKIVMKKWKLQDDINFNDFSYVEPILWQRAVMLNIHHEQARGSREQIMEMLAQVHLEMASLARTEGFHQVAVRCHRALSEIVQPTSNIKNKLKLEEACLSWEQGEVEVGKCLLRSLLSNLSTARLTEEDIVHYSWALKLYGDWMVETKSENPQVIMNNYFLKAMELMEKINRGTKENEHLLEIYWSLARFADGKYQHLLHYCKSYACVVKKEWIGKAVQGVTELKQMSDITNDYRKAIILMESLSSIDKTEIENTEKEKDMYLTNAMMYYLRGLQHGDKNNLQIFRVASLWLNNMLHKDLNRILQENLFQVPSYKFIPLLPQITPRMSNVDDAFSSKLNILIERCALDHPYHTLPHILALANSYKDREYIKAAAPSQNSPHDEPRVLGARQMADRLLSKPKVGPLLHKMDVLSTAIISLAYIQVKPSPRSSYFQIPHGEKLHTLRDLSSVAVPTLTIPVRINCCYEDIIGIRKFEPTFSLVGGINAPKKILCIGTDGIPRPQLVKGQDDLRQDAVMQQVFTIINMFLKNNKDTSKRKLQIRTYKVMPLSQRSGIIEWCQNTQPMGVYLLGSDGKSGAHRKYYPQDLPPIKCKEKMRAAAAKSDEGKLQTYKEICKGLHPVFRYFFLENFPTPGVWFERRLAYIHSVATSSMIGYILGLGDRHTSNILIDSQTAEVIHIDFGIAFEMGHILPVPETVPFRLTRNIVDGMGVCGIEGVFRRSCEKTMAVLRQNQSTILTILEVLLYDPLYAWTITPIKGCNMQRLSSELNFAEEEESSVEVNKTAERALIRLQQKLQGVEEGTTTSVAGQVNHLLQQASDPSNLSRLYFGWQPYL